MNIYRVMCGQAQICVIGALFCVIRFSRCNLCALSPLVIPVLQCDTEYVVHVLTMLYPSYLMFLV